MVLDERSQSQKSCTLDDLFTIDGQSSNAKDCLRGFWEQGSEEEGRQTVWRVLSKQTGCLGAHTLAILLEPSQHPGDGSSRALSSQTTKLGVWGDSWVVLAAPT